MCNARTVKPWNLAISHPNYFGTINGGVSAFKTTIIKQSVSYCSSELDALHITKMYFAYSANMMVVFLKEIIFRQSDHSLDVENSMTFPIY